MHAETAKLAPFAESQRFFAASAIVIAAILLLSFPLACYLPVVSASRQFHLLHHVHGLTCFAWFGLCVWRARLVGSTAVLLPLQISSPWVSRTDCWNTIAPGLIGSPQGDPRR